MIKIVIIVVVILCLTCFIYLRLTTFRSEPIKSSLIYIDTKDLTIIDILKQTAEKYPDRPALKIKNNTPEEDEWKTTSYADYYKKVINFATSAHKLVGSNATVGIMGFNSPGWFYAYLGAMANNGISVAINSNSSPKTCEVIIKKTSIKILVVENDEQLKKLLKIHLPQVELIIYYSPVNPETIKKFEIPVISMGSFMEQKSTKIKYPKQKHSAAIISTDVIITHKNIVTATVKTVDLLKKKSKLTDIGFEQYLSYHNLDDIQYQLFDIFIPIYTVGTVWFAEPACPNGMQSTLLQTIEVVKPTIMIGDNDVWNKVMEFIDKKHKKYIWTDKLISTFSSNKILSLLGISTCKLFVNTSLEITDQTRTYLKNNGIILNDMFGKPESCGIISISAPGIHKPKSVGIPIMNIKLDVDGEILIEGDNLFSKYNDNTKKTNQSFRDLWFKTGIFGYLDKEGYLFLKNC